MGSTNLEQLKSLFKRVTFRSNNDTYEIELPRQTFAIQFLDGETVCLMELISYKETSETPGETVEREIDIMSFSDAVQYVRDILLEN